MDQQNVCIEPWSRGSSSWYGEFGPPGTHRFMTFHELIMTDFATETVHPHFWTNPKNPVVQDAVLWLQDVAGHAVSPVGISRWEPSPSKVRPTAVTSTSRTAMSFLTCGASTIMDNNGWWQGRCCIRWNRCLRCVCNPPAVAMTWMDLDDFRGVTVTHHIFAWSGVQ